jgi:hypothetical protein
VLGVLSCLRDPLLTRLVAAPEEHRVSGVERYDVPVQIALEPFQFDLRLLELAASGNHVDHARNLSQRFLEPAPHEGVELFGADEGASGAGLRGRVLAEVGDGMASVDALASDDLQRLDASRAAGEAKQEAVTGRVARRAGCVVRVA